MTGDAGFDPIGFSNFLPLDFLREAELKHGRICQLAVVGFAATDLGLHLPGAMHDVSSINSRNFSLRMPLTGSVLFLGSILVKALPHVRNVAIDLPVLALFVTVIRDLRAVYSEVNAGTNWAETGGILDGFASCTCIKSRLSLIIESSREGA